MKKTCYNCKNYWDDRDVGAAECEKDMEMTDEEFDKHFINDEPDCPYWEKQADIDYEE